MPRQNLSETSVPLNLVLRGVVDYGETEAVAVDVYWRWEDEETMEPQFLAKGVVGQTIAVPFDPKRPRHSPLPSLKNIAIVKKRPFRQRRRADRG
ncbi:MAG: hypothetical protein IPL32_20440 [Chloracidobacterium sp.]|nr:hypothetical protein [Chloracidobacterium sp.]